jgi:predicted ABC-type ATPase
MLTESELTARSTTKRNPFAFETTLASRNFAPWLRTLRQGFKVHVAFLSLPTADLAVARVAERVRQGGHDVREAVVRRRFVAGSRTSSLSSCPWQTLGRCSTTRELADRA